MVQSSENAQILFTFGGINYIVVLSLVTYSMQDMIQLVLDTVNVLINMNWRKLLLMTMLASVG